MARGRKSIYVKTITGRDEKLLAQLSRTGICSVDQAKKYCELNPERLSKLQNSGYIKMENHAVYGRNAGVITLAKEGKEHCRENLGTTEFSQAQTNHLHHDLKLTEIYYSLPDRAQETWRHEQLIVKDMYNENPELRGNLKTCIDATITVPREWVENHFRHNDNYENFDSAETKSFHSTEIVDGGDVTIATESVGSTYTDELMEEKADIAISVGCAGMYSI